MARKQVVRRKAIFADFTPQSKKRLFIAESKKQKDNNSFLELAADNNHLFPNQSMPALANPSKISSLLSDISEANCLLLPKTFQDLEDKDFLEWLNISQDNHTTV